MNVEEAPMTAEGIEAALKAGTMNIRTEEWRRRLLAYGLEDQDVRMMILAVDMSREIFEHVSSKVTIAIKVGIFCLGVVSVLVHRQTADNSGRVVVLVGGLVCMLIAAVMVLYDESEHRRAKEIQKEVLALLQASLKLPPV